MRSIWKHNITVCLMALLFALTGNSHAGNVEVKLPTNSAFQVISGVQPLMHVGSNRKIGIGTTSPGELVHIEGPDGDMILRTTEGDESINYGSNIQGQRKNSTGAVAAGNELMAVSGDGWDGSVFTEAAAMLINVDGTVSAGIVPGRVTFRTQDSAGVRAERMRIDNNGNVGIGTTSPGRKLTIYDPYASFWNSGIGLEREGGYDSRINVSADGLMFRNFNSTGATPAFSFRDVNDVHLVEILGNGNVGIGATNPSQKLHIIETNGDAGLSLDTTANGTNGRASINLSMPDRVWYIQNDGALNVFKVRDATAAADRLAIDYSGNVGIGTTSPSYKLHVNGTAAGTSWTNLSSREFKEDINVVGESEHPMMLAKLMDMDLTRYRYKKEYGGDDEAKIGFIAEEMPKEVLSKDGKGVDVYELLTFTIGAMKAQQKEIEAQRQYNKALEDRLAALEKLLEGK